MSYAYHPLARVGAFTKPNARVATYQTQWDLWETPVRQCPGCLAPNKSVCTCAATAREEARAAKLAAAPAPRVAKSAAAVVDWKPEAKQGDKAAIHEARLERHLDALARIPAALRGGYLANLPKSLRIELQEYL